VGWLPDAAASTKPPPRVSNVLPIRRLVVGPPPAPDRILFTELWYRGHNNPRYSQFLPRLERLDRYHPVVSDRQIVRGLQFRALRTTAVARHRLMFAAARRRGYRSLFASERQQIRYWPGPAVVDCDDPKFSAEEVALLKRPNLLAYVVVREAVARRYEQLGVEKPWHVIPHGVNLRSLTPENVAAVRERHRADGELVIGFHASWLLSHGDRNGDDPFHNVDHLLDLWDEMRSRVPRARLWLIGEASGRVRRRCAGRADILQLGRIPQEDLLAYVANYDIALYARSADHGTFQTTKVVEFMGCGVPTVAYDYDITAHVREAGAGVLVRTPREFVDAVERLAGDPALRRRLGAAARVAGSAQDYDTLARRYAGILDRYL
jgi:glycosyltransferase involved in cell wall biosynthesis